MSNLVDYAEKELNLAGLLDADSDYNGMLGVSALEIIEIFSKQGHSGMSASIVTSLVGELMQYHPLTPLTYEPDEWNNVSDISFSPMWQNKRKSSTFSVDGGKTHYDLNDEKPEPVPEVKKVDPLAWAAIGALGAEPDLWDMGIS